MTRQTRTDAAFVLAAVAAVAPFALQLTGLSGGAVGEEIRLYVGNLSKLRRLSGLKTRKQVRQLPTLQDVYLAIVGSHHGLAETRSAGDAAAGAAQRFGGPGGPSRRNGWPDEERIVDA